MSWVKPNGFHWHITDSQSFLLSLLGFTELAIEGAYRPTSICTAQDVPDIIAYAGKRGIDVMLEINMPGYTSSIGSSYPDFIVCFDASPWATYANEPPAGQLRLVDNTVITFTTSLFQELVGLVQSPYISMGGDEINQPCYDNDTVTQQDLTASGQTFEQALNAFVGATHQVLQNAGKTPTVWEGSFLCVCFYI